MKKQWFVFGLLLLCVLVSCSKDELELKERIIYKSEPLVSMSANEDSLYVEGYSTCTTFDLKKGVFPENVIKEFGLDKKYIYTLYHVSVDIELSEKYVYTLPVNKDKWGYMDKELSARGCMVTSPTVENGIASSQVSAYFVHVTQEVNGDAMDMWLPYPPKDIYWKCMLKKTN
ncbi:hypothetical protein [Parabacteroides sp.]